MPYEVTTRSPEQTQALGRCLGQLVQQGLALRLSGELGSGKTCFVQGLAEGLQVPREYSVTSPSYTLVNEYPGRLPFYHIDLYRLERPADAEAIGVWEIIGSEAVVAVEWAERLPEEVWPPQSLVIEFRLAEGDDHVLLLKACGLGLDNLIEQAFDQYHRLPVAR